jgi:hypothetical protein
MEVDPPAALARTVRRIGEIGGAMMEGVMTGGIPMDLIGGRTHNRREAMEEEVPTTLASEQSGRERRKRKRR